MMQRADYGHWRAETEKPFPPRQLEVLARVAEGLTDKEIARDMGISPGTANAHVERLRFRLGMSRNRLEAVGEAIRRGILKPLIIAVLAVGSTFGIQHTPVETQTAFETRLRKHKARRQP